MANTMNIERKARGGNWVTIAAFASDAQGLAAWDSVKASKVTSDSSEYRLTRVSFTDRGNRFETRLGNDVTIDHLA